MANHDFNYDLEDILCPGILEEYEYYFYLAKKMRRYLKSKKFITPTDAYYYSNKYRGGFKSMCKFYKKNNKWYRRFKRAIKEKIDLFILKLTVPY